MHAAPRHFAAYSPLPGAGLPHDRMARLAARRAFVELKDHFMRAAESIGGGDGLWLRAQIRSAEQPEDLLLLRGAVFDGLAGDGPGRRSLRQSLRRGLDSIFPDSAPVSGFADF